MLSTTPLMLYQQSLDAGDYQPDDVQRKTVERLDEIYHQLIERSKNNQPEKSLGFKQRLGKLLNKKTPSAIPPVQGLYLWGGVGRGKTWLMDMFYQSLPIERKLRLHFHRFIQRVQQELIAQQGKENPLEIIADGFKAQADVVCFDEFFVSDITDAMILGTLFEALFARGITLIATSNIPG